MVDYRLLNYGNSVAEARPAVCVGDNILDIQDALADVGNPKSFVATSTLTILEKWDASEPVLEQIADKLANGHAKAKKLSFKDQRELETLPSTIEKLEAEIGDLMCMVDLLVEKCIISDSNINEHRKQKREKLKTWSSIEGL